MDRRNEKTSRLIMNTFMDLLKEKGFDGVECVAHGHIGNDKITLTVKPVKGKFGGRQIKEAEQNDLESYTCFEPINSN